jgi:putative hydrolase of the HAD superfamily
MRRKPDPAIFHYAARLSNSPTSECIYIGDRISRDVLGAKRAGFKLAIQIKHDFIHGEKDDGATPDLIINNMTELLEILEKENQAKHKLSAQKSIDNKIRAVLFDADGVLYYRKDRDEEVNAFIKKFGKRGIDIADTAIKNLRHKAFIGQITFEQYKAEVFKLYGITDPQLIAGGIQKAYQDKEDISYFNDAYETLCILKNQKLYLGIITDTAQPLYAKLNKLERGGIGHLWDSITPSNEVGVQKPDPEIYQLALRQLGIGPEQAVFVGHKTSELDGAHNIGLHTIAFNYDEDAKADYYIENFSDLARLPILN